MRALTPILMATVALCFAASQVDAAPKPKKRDKDPEVAEFERAIAGKGWVACRPDGSHKSGWGAAMGVLKGEDNEALEARIAEAKAYRDAKVDFIKKNTWARRACWVRSEHFELCCDIKNISLIGVCGGSGAADVMEATLTYTERAERIWSDMEAIFGKESMPSYHKTVFLWDKDEAGRINRNTVNREVFKDFLTADHKGGGSNFHNGNYSNIWWEQAVLTTDDKLWEHFTHIVSQMLQLSRSGYYGNDMNAFGWLAEGWAFYLTRIHRELDNCTTQLFQEGKQGKGEHIHGNAYLATAQAMAKAGSNPDKGGYTPFEQLFLMNVNAMSLRQRVQAWAIVKYIIEVYGKETYVKFIDGTSERKKSPQIVEEVLGLTMKQFQDEWVQYLTDKKFADKKKAELEAKRAAKKPDGDPPAGN